MTRNGPGALRRLARLIRSEMGAAFRTEPLAREGRTDAVGTMRRRWAAVLAVEALPSDPCLPAIRRPWLRWLLAPELLPLDDVPPRSSHGRWRILAAEALPEEAPQDMRGSRGFLRRLLAPEPLPFEPGREGRP